MNPLVSTILLWERRLEALHHRHVDQRSPFKDNPKATAVEPRQPAPTGLRRRRVRDLPVDRQA